MSMHPLQIPYLLVDSPSIHHTYLTYKSTLLDLLSFLPCLLEMLLFFSPHLLASTGVQPVLSHMLFYHAGFKKYYFPHDSTFYFVLIASPSFIPSFPDISSSGILLSLPNLVAYPACLTWQCTLLALFGILPCLPLLVVQPDCLTWYSSLLASLGSLACLPHLVVQPAGLT